MKILSKFKYIFLPSALILHVVLIIARGYFLSAEFSLYPYLVNRGFLPYRDLVDQHFPTLFFGPFSLPSFLTTNPWPLLGLFLVTLCLTDIFFYLSLLRFKVIKSYVWLVFFIVSSVYFSGNILWVETFVNLLLSLYLFLSFSQNNLRKFIGGFLLSQVLLLRPTIAPALLILIISLSKFSWALFLGGLTGIAIPLLYIFKQGILSDFYLVAIKFNQSVYPQEARALPGKRHIATLLFWLFPAVISFIKNKKILFLIITIFLLILAFPRFGYEHLQPLFFLTTILYAITVKKPNILIYLFILLFFCLNLIAIIRHPYGNYYLTPEVQEISKKIKDLPGQEIYLLGASDILYQLSGKMPPNYTYVPSLPWYLHQKEFNDKIISSLEKSHSLVLVDPQASIDSKNIVVESGNLFDYIKMNYTKGEMIGNFQLYLPNL